MPHLAKREHQKNLVPVLIRALTESGIMKQEARKRIYPFAPHDSRFKILDSILAREPELLADVRKRILPLRPPKIDAIAVTVGPGLAPALWVGVNFARALAYLWGRPVIPVNHLEGHIYTNLLSKSRQNNESDEGDKIVRRFHRAERFIGFIDLIRIRFPALCLIVSGGHTELVLMRRYGDYRILGETLDDAAGEAFDKVAKMMGLGFPGGPIVSKLAERGDPAAIKFPRPMINSKDFNFSFSGLKTAVFYFLRSKLSSANSESRTNIRIRKFERDSLFADVSASFEQAAADVLVAKTIRAARQYRAKTVMIGGGVAANKKLRAELGTALTKQYPSTQYLVPNSSLTGDNALMIALAGWFNRKKKSAWRSVQADANLRLDG